MFQISCSFTCLCSSPQRGFCWLPYNLVKSHHKRHDMDMFMCYSRSVKLCTYDLAFSKNKYQFRCFLLPLHPLRFSFPRVRYAHTCRARNSTYVVNTMFKMKSCPTKNCYMQSNTLIHCLAQDELQITNLAEHLCVFFVSDGGGGKKAKFTRPNSLHFWCERGRAVNKAKLFQIYRKLYLLSFFIS